MADLTSSTPEQVIGNAFALVTRLKRLGIGLDNRPQAIGSAIVATLRRNGYEVVRTDYLRLIETGNDDLDAEVERLKEQLASATRNGS